MCSVHITAPRRAMARCAMRNSGTLGSWIATTSPAPTPRWRSPSATRSTRSCSASQVSTAPPRSIAAAPGRSRRWRPSHFGSVSSSLHQPRAMYSRSIAGSNAGRFIGRILLCHAGSPVRSPGPFPGSVRPEHRLPHPLSGDHDRAVVAPRLCAGAPCDFGRARLARDLSALGEGIRAHVRRRRRHRHRDELPVRHELARLHEQGRRRRRAAARLRGADRVPLRGDLPRRDALRHRARAGLGAPALHPRGRRRHHGLRVLDPRAQLLDADARRPCRRGRAGAARKLARRDLQPLLPLALRPHGARLGDHRRLPRRRPRRVAPARRAGARGRACLAADGRARRRGAAAAADLRRRPARPQHARAPAGEDRGHRGALAHRARRAAHAVRAGGRGAPRKPLRDRSAERRLARPHPFRRGRGEGPRRLRGPCAGHAGVPRVQGDGRHRAGDARPRLGQPALPPAPAALAALGLRPVHVLRLGRGARRMDRHGSRAPALARHRDPAHRRRARRGGTGAPGREPHRVRADLRRAAPRIRLHPVPHGAQMTIDLPLAFTLLMGLAILLYVLLDGYDLGVGMLIAGAERDEHDVMVASIGPFWDANETWLVLGIGVLLTAFPVAHGLILGELYLPVAAMLVGLMFRGVAFELRLKARGWQRELWNWLFWAGSFLAAFSQGLMLGRYVTGFAPGFGEWLFALLVGASLCGGYVLLGAAWLVLKTEGALQKKALAWSRWGLAWVALGVALVSLATPLASETVREKWFTLPRFLVLSPLPLAT